MSTPEVGSLISDARPMVPDAEAADIAATCHIRLLVARVLRPMSAGRRVCRALTARSALVLLVISGHTLLTRHPSLGRAGAVPCQRR